MKKILNILLLFLIVTSCNKAVEIKDSYVINGTAEGVHNGIRVYLKTVDERGRQTNKDTAIVINESFSFEGKADIPGVYFFFVNGIKQNLPFMLENGDISVTIKKDSIRGSKVTGTKSNDYFLKYSNEKLKLQQKSANLNVELRQAVALNQDTDAQRIKAEFAKTQDVLKNFPLDFAATYNDNYFALTLIESTIENKSVDFDKLVETFNNIDDNIRGSKYGKIVFNKIEFKKQKMASLAFLDIGKVAPKFSAPDADDNTVALDDILGKVTIIDFWASWCGPCRKENPNVVRTYEQYHDKGLEIISVSLDKPGQKQRWLDAIKKDNLNWHHVSNLKYFNDPVAQLYNIQSIPSTFILDEDGKIVAKNLRGAALGEKIGELLN